MAKHHTEHSIELKLPGSPSYEQVARATAVSIVRQMGFRQDHIDALDTALGEAYRNAIEHGNRGDDMLPVTIKFKLQQTCLLVEIVDHGEGFELPQSPDIDEQVAGREDRRGWGIHLMQNLVDQVSFHVNEQGEHFTCLYLFKNDVGNVRQGEDR
ncbi:ATP-binding protein [Candidatus Bathyarchaeota archaeon]|nr:ATP-binding protein [Candidatus Bathyarchaeota archaeon]